MFSKNTVKKTLEYVTLFVVLLLDNNCHTRAFLLNMSRYILQTQNVQNISLKKRSQSILLGEVSDWSSTAVQYSQWLWNLLEKCYWNNRRLTLQHPWNLTFFNFPYSTGSARPLLPHLLNKSFRNSVEPKQSIYSNWEKSLLILIRFRHTFGQTRKFLIRYKSLLADQGQIKTISALWDPLCVQESIQPRTWSLIDWY